jgi:hypothetical protein
MEPASEKFMEIMIVGLALLLCAATWLIYRMAAALQVRK